ncbi:hypothetical protein C8J56DRAFT_794029 [Mycena floridula]|nr:hypothetical protein C8J56DRAFT_794029 [Mycena floridula]
MWYESPSLAEGAHALSVTNLTSAEIDFMVVTPGPNTLLLDNFLLIDDSYSGIQYSGSWSTEKPPGVQVPSLLFQSGSHSSNTNGDSLSFSFTGKSQSQRDTYLLNKYPRIKSDGLWDATIDGGAPVSESVKITTDPLKLTPIYTTGVLSPGKHTVNLTVLQSSNQLLIVDFLLYEPGFSTLSQMPDLSSPSSSSTSAVARSTSTSGPEPSSSPTSLLAKKTPVGAIAGGVVGGIIVLTAVLALLFFLHQREARRRNHQSDRYGQSLSFHIDLYNE